MDEKLIVVFRNAEMTYEGLLGHFSKTGIDERAAKLKHHYHRLTGKCSVTMPSALLTSVMVKQYRREREPTAANLHCMA